MTDPTQNQSKPDAQTVPVKPPVFKPVAGMYKNLRGRKIFNAKGIPLKETNGYFDPKTAEEKELCAYFESIGNVEPVK